MNLFRNAVFAAAIAGLFAGLIMTAMQTFATVPLILQAETFEGAGMSGHHHGTATAATAGAQVEPAAAEDHDGGAWAPADGFERFAFTALANIVTGIGFALLLVAASEFAGGIAGWRQGVFWGFAGFAVFTLAPGLGLPPELPTMPTADLMDRQVWWIATVAATAGGLALIAFRGSVVFSLVGVALIVTPHLIGAPQPASHESPLPDGLHHQFVVAATVTSLIFWVLLGGMVGMVRQHLLATAGGPSKSFA
ncbi:CbtA family protein [Mesorhizobium sp. 10J20-29]